MSADTANEILLRFHIRKLLLNYALTHLTIDYLTYTQHQAIELLSESLDFVPEHDPASLTFPVEPLEALSISLDIPGQTQYDEIWRVDTQVKKFMTTALSGTRQQPPTKLCWSYDHSESFNPVRPFSPPLLTRRARRETPVLGMSEPLRLLRSLKLSDGSLQKYAGITFVPQERIEQPTITQDQRNHLLGIRLTLDKESHQVIKSIFDQVPVFQPRPKSMANMCTPLSTMALEFLRSGSPPITNSNLRPMSPPIFSRQVQKPVIPGPKKLSDIRVSGLVKEVTLEKEAEEDMSKLNMQVLGGWNVLVPSQSDTPTLDEGSQSSQVDELFALTPPQTETNLYYNKMDDFIISRADQPGKGKFEQTRDNSSIPEFLRPMISLIPAGTVTEFEGTPIQERSPISSSILGQPTSPSKSNNTHENTEVQKLTDCDKNENGLYPLIGRLSASVVGQPPEGWILRERLDSKEAMMMDVPMMKEPNLHPPSSSCPLLPFSIHCLLSLEKLKEGNAFPYPKTEQSRVACLKKVTGIQSLNTELSWRPFNFGTAIPNTEELVDVLCLPDLDLITTENNANLLKEDSKETVAKSDRSMTYLGEEVPVDWSSKLGFEKDWGGHDVALTRAERIRLYRKTTGTLGSERDIDNAEGNEKKEILYRDTGSPLRPYKRRKVDEGPFASKLPDEAAFRNDSCGTFELVPGFSFHALRSLSHCGPLSQSSSDDDLTFAGNDQAILEGLELIGTGPWTAENLEYQGTPPAAQLRKICKKDDGSQGSATEDVVIQTLLPVCSNLAMAPLSAAFEKSLPKAAVLAAKDVINVNHDATRLDKVSQREALLDFMRLRGKNIGSLPAPVSSSPQPQEPEILDVPPPSPKGPPDEVLDSKTVILPSDWTPPPSHHNYIASVNLIQKTVLVHHLTSSDCKIELVERIFPEHRSVDLILDADTALLFIPLSSLPVAGSALAERLANLSWDYDRIMVVFEAFLSSSTVYREKHADRRVITPYAFSPAVLKAIRSLKRTLAIMESVGGGNETCTKRTESAICYAYAKNVKESARIARFVGDGLDLQVNRDWLEEDYCDEEMDLAQVKGMNVFTAALILRHTDLNTFIDMQADDRFKIFAPYVGERRMTILNEEIAIRLAYDVKQECVPPSYHVAYARESPR